MTDGVVGLLGLGNMGAALAKRLTMAYRVVAFDPDAARQAVGADIGVEVAGSTGAVGAAADIVVLSLPRPEISRGAVADLVVAWGGAGGLVIETSTVTPGDARSMHEACVAAGAQFVDAAILSGVALVEAGGSTFLVGGDDEAVERAQPVLDAVCVSQRRLGPPGAGMAAKVINNAVAHAVYVVLAEAAAMAVATGVPVADLVDLLSAPDGGLMRPLTHRIGERLADRDFDGGMRTDAAYKDSTLALAVAQEHGVPLFATQAAHTVYEIAAGPMGMGGQDYSVLATLWEHWTGRSMSDRA